MEKKFEAIRIKTDPKEKEVILRLGDYNADMKIPLCQLDMVVDLLKEAKEELAPISTVGAMGQYVGPEDGDC